MAALCQRRATRALPGGSSYVVAASTVPGLCVRRSRDSVAITACSYAWRIAESASQHPSVSTAFSGPAHLRRSIRCRRFTCDRLPTSSPLFPTARGRRRCHRLRRESTEKIVPLQPGFRGRCSGSLSKVGPVAVRPRPEFGGTRQQTAIDVAARMRQTSDRHGHTTYPAC
jgi:hypothetical protein